MDDGSACLPPPRSQEPNSIPKSLASCRRGGYSRVVLEGSISIRELREADLDAVVCIASASPEAAAWKRQDYARALEDQPAWLCRVADWKGTTAGFVCFRVLGPEAELLNLAVDPRRRGQGIGARLVGGMLEEAAQRSAVRVFLEVRDSNFAAMRLYEKQGFQVLSRRPAYYSNPTADALVLHRVLPSAVAAAGSPTGSF